VAVHGATDEAADEATSTDGATDEVTAATDEAIGKWATEVAQLGQMGFLAGAVVVQLLDKHYGDIDMVVADLVSE
jgi:hypothetical protein